MEKDLLSKKIQNLIYKKYKILETVEISIPKEDSFGDYSSNIILKLNSKYDIDKNELFEYLSKNLEHYKIEAVNFFLNIFINDNSIIDYLKGNKPEIKKRSEKVLVEYSSPNIAKPFSVSHATTTIIGDSIYRIYKYLKYEVTNDNHIGDWGVQFGKLIYAINNWGDYSIIEKDPINELNKLYIKFHKEEEKNPELTIKAKEIYKKLSENDKTIISQWEKIIKWSMDNFNNVYNLLEIKFENTLGESFYANMAKRIINNALEKKIATKENGAVVIYTDPNKKPLIIEKSDGTTLYSTHDLATIEYRAQKLKENIIIYEIGSDQKNIIEQMFKAAELLNLYDKNKTQLILISHGIIKLSGGEKFSTRKGNIIKLEEIIDESFKRAKGLLEERGIDNEDSVKKIAIGAIKFNILKRHYSSDIIFEWNKLLDFNGDTSVYIQYTYVRCNSIIQKSTNLDSQKDISISNEQEQNLARLLYKFNDYVDSAKLSPNILVDYLLTICKRYNFIYSKYPILKEKDQNIKYTRILLTKNVQETIKTGLNLLGINIVKKM